MAVGVYALHLHERRRALERRVVRRPLDDPEALQCDRRGQDRLGDAKAPTGAAALDGPRRLPYEVGTKKDVRDYKLDGHEGRDFLKLMRIAQLQAAFRILVGENE
jgi:hypothetical protein